MQSAADIAAIVNLINLYPVAVDSQTWDLFDRIFTEDAHADFGGPAVWTDRATLKTAFAAIHAPFAATQHITTNHHVSVTGDRATCLSYVHGHFIRPVDGVRALFDSIGWYDDTLVRTADGWRIARRVCRSQWAGGNPAVMGSAPAVDAEGADPPADTLRDEAAAGRIGHIAALIGR